MNTAKKIIAIVSCFIIVTGCALSDGGKNMSNSNTPSSIQIRTDTDPIYNHFPEIPKFGQIQWASTTSEGIGLTTVHLYIFLVFDESSDLDVVLKDYSLSDEGVEIESIFYPDGISKKGDWRKINDVPFCFQEALSQTKRINTDVYASQEHKAIFIHAIG